MPLKRISDCLGTLINALAQVFPDMNSIFDPLTEKNDPHIRIPAGFSGSGWAKLRGENSHDVMAFGGL
jgi:hypothetical protein